MISFDLRCASGHGFEGWFGSHADYTDQCDRGLLSCPLCNSTRVEKLLSAPNVGRKSNQVPKSKAASPPKPAKDTASMSNSSAVQVDMKDAIEKLSKMQADALKESQWVGRQFAEEARAIHYGETENRIIHGETNADEAEALAEEGVPVAPLIFPFVPPEAKN